MVAINLDPLKEEQLRTLAQSRGEEVEAIARRILEDYLDFNSLSDVSPDDWAESSAQLAAEILPPDEWSENDGGTSE